MARNLQQICALPVQISAEIRARGVDGAAVSVWLARDDSSPNRSRGTALFLMEVGLSWAPDLERVLLVDKRGNPCRAEYKKWAEWIGKNMSGRAVSLSLHVPNSAAVPPAWTARRIQAMADDAASVSTVLPVYLQAAQAKKNTAAQWMESARKAEILGAARAVEWCDYFRRTTGPTGAMGADKSAGPWGDDSDTGTGTGSTGGTGGTGTGTGTGGTGTGTGTGTGGTGGTNELPQHWAWREDVGLYAWKGLLDPDSSMHQHRAFTAAFPSANLLEQNGSLVYEHFANAGFRPEFFDAVNVKYSQCRALLNGVELFVQDNVPYGARIGYLLARLHVRRGEVMTVDLEADGVVRMRAFFVAEPVDVGEAVGYGYVELVS